MKTKKEISDAEKQAKAQLASIVEMVNRLDDPEISDEERDDAIQTIREDALEVSVRSGWTTPGEEMKAEEFLILLCTGGPAVRLIGDLDEHSQSECVRIQYQDWGTPWTEYFPSTAERQALLRYAEQFFFGE